MKIAIVGDTSMLGKRLFARLRMRHSVIRVGRAVTSDVLLDLEQEWLCASASGKVDAVVHCAASFAGNSLDEAARNELINAVGALRVAQFAAAASCAHIVYISTISVYEGAEGNVISSYGLSKRHAEENVRWACEQTGIALTVLRPSQLYDELGEARKHQPMLYAIVDRARAGCSVRLDGAVDPLRNYLYIDDFVGVIERVIEKKVLGIFAAVNPVSHRLSEVAETAFRVFGRGGDVVFRPGSPNIASIYIPDDVYLYETLGYSPSTDLETGMSMIRDEWQRSTVSTP